MPQRHAILFYGEYLHRRIVIGTAYALLHAFETHPAQAFELLFRNENYPPISGAGGYRTAPHPSHYQGFEFYQFLDDMNGHSIDGLEHYVYHMLFASNLMDQSVAPPSCATIRE